MNSDSSPMAVHSNRSPSPLSSSRPSNPNPRISENNSANRRSFSKPTALANLRRFDPTTPANSPSDFSRRRGEEKENDEKDQAVKALKHQSPVAKGCKNFMSPTISAASKFTPSPRKKVLVERNDPVRTSISLSDGKAMFFSSTMSSNVPDEHDSTSEMGYNQNQKAASVVDLKAADSETKNPVSKPTKRVSFLDVPMDSQHPSQSPLESVSSKEKVDSSTIAPLDADPLLPPYDPKTNYLSPRPQFLHYKPNPRIDILLNKEKGLDPEELKRLEDDLVEEILSENFSDSDEGTEDSQSEYAQKEEVDAAPSSDMVIGMDEIEGSHVCEPSEPLLDSASVNEDVISGDELVQKIEKKPRAVFRMVFFSTLLMLLIAACISVSVTHSSFHDEYMPKDLSNFYEQSTYAAGSYARVKFEMLSRHVNQLRIRSSSYFSKLVNELRKGGEETPLQFVNLSELQQNAWNEDELEEDGLEEDLEDTTEMDTYEEELDTEIDTYEEEAYEEIEEEFSAEEDVPITETEIDSDDIFEKGNDVPITEETSPVSVEVAESKPDDSQDIQSQSEVMISSINTNQWAEEVKVDQETEHESPVEVASDPDSSSSSAETILSDQSNVNTQSSSSSQDSSFQHIVIGVSSLAAALLSAAAFTYNKHKKNPNSANVIQADHPLEFTATTTKHMAYSQNWETEVDINGGESSCPSEVSSSFQKGSSCSTERKRRKLSKRESLASSSEFSIGGSPSYGSFTTFERIPIRHGDGDEEIITPVRRSSRIRNHQFPVTSP